MKSQPSCPYRKACFEYENQNQLSKRWSCFLNFTGAGCMINFAMEKWTILRGFLEFSALSKYKWNRGHSSRKLLWQKLTNLRDIGPSHGSDRVVMCRGVPRGLVPKNGNFASLSYLPAAFRKKSRLARWSSRIVRRGGPLQIFLETIWEIPSVAQFLKWTVKGELRWRDHIGKHLDLLQLRISKRTGTAYPTCSDISRSLK